MNSRHAAASSLAVKLFARLAFVTSVAVAGLAAADPQLAAAEPKLLAAAPARDQAPLRVGRSAIVDLRDTSPGMHVVEVLVELEQADPRALRMIDEENPNAPPLPCQIETVADEPRAVRAATAVPQPGLTRKADPAAPAAPRVHRLWWAFHESDAARKQRSFRLEVGAPVAAAGLVVDRTDDALVVRSGERSILRYNVRHVAAPAGADPKYGRSAHLHPVWTPAGKIVTDEFPPDHLHQSGVFLAYTKARFEGRETNFWDLAGGLGRVRHKRVLGVQSGPVFASFEVEHEHVDLTSGAEKVALVETWEVRVWNVGGPNAGYWTWDVCTTRRCATDEPLKLPTYHYGGMALRGARGWKIDNSNFLTSEGKTRADGNHTRPRWCDLTGPVDGRPAGLALLTHPENFRHPEPLRIHPSMPYMVYTPSQLGDWEIAPGEAPVSRYRFVAHDGEPDAKRLEAVWNDFARPPAVTVLPSR